LLFAAVGGVLLFIPIWLLQHDAGDDGQGLIGYKRAKRFSMGKCCRIN
jgi:hypothetical protein